jgi:hypothetical protein
MKFSSSLFFSEFEEVVNQAKNETEVGESLNKLAKEIDMLQKLEFLREISSDLDHRVKKAYPPSEAPFRPSQSREASTESALTNKIIDH